MILRDDSTRPLVVRMGALGDMVMLTPLLKAIYERTGLAADLVAYGEWNRKLFAHSPWVNKIYTVKSRRTPLWLSPSKQALVKELSPHGANRRWFFNEHIPQLQHMMLRANCSETLSVLAKNFPRKTGEHTCEQWMRMADHVYDSAVGEPTKVITQLHCSLEEIQECKVWLASAKKVDCEFHKIVLVQAGNKKNMRKGRRDRASNIKYWPEEQWSNVIDRILDAEPNTRVLLCGAPAEADLCSDIAVACKTLNRGRIIECAADLPLTRLMALASIADACISVDTGPAHIASAVGCPLVVLFGQSDARQYKPMGISDVRVVANRDWQTFMGSGAEWAAQNAMSDISVKQVFQAYQQLQDRQPMLSPDLVSEHQQSNEVKSAKAS